MRPLTGAANSNGLDAIHTGSLACSLKMTSGQPLPVRFHSWIFACSVVAPLPSPSKVTILHLDLRMRLDVSLRRRQADGVDPDGDRAGNARGTGALGAGATGRGGDHRHHGRYDERRDGKPPAVDLHVLPPPSLSSIAACSRGHRTGVARCSCDEARQRDAGLRRGAHQAIRPDTRFAGHWVGRHE